MDNRELAAVLAGLRIFQMLREHGGIVGARLYEIMDEIGADGGNINPLTPDEIDALCERLNTQPAKRPKPWFTLDLEAPTPVHSGEPDQALIWSFEHNGWWAPGRQGYVSDVDAAGRYLLAEARQIVETANIAAINEAIVLLPRNRVPAQRPTGTEEDRR